LKIKYVDWGIANRYENCIEINKAILKYPNLHAKILEHELAHTNSKGFTWYDFKLDLFQKYPKEKWKFMFENPKATFQQHFPISIKDNNILVNVNLLVLYSLTGLLSLFFFHFFNQILIS
jgi:hypothetical protein